MKAYFRYGIIHLDRWESPLSRTPKQIGDFRIESRLEPAGFQRLREVVDGDELIYVEHPFWVNYLEEFDGKKWSPWMTDEPIFAIRTQELARQTIGGNYILGGLGLGLMTLQLSLRADVKGVIVIEKSQDVIDLVAFLRSLQPPAVAPAGAGGHEQHN